MKITLSPFLKTILLSLWPLGGFFLGKTLIFGAGLFLHGYVHPWYMYPWYAYLTQVWLPIPLVLLALALYKRGRGSPLALYLSLAQSFALSFLYGAKALQTLPPLPSTLAQMGVFWQHIPFSQLVPSAGAFMASLGIGGFLIYERFLEGRTFHTHGTARLATLSEIHRITHKNSKGGIPLGLLTPGYDPYSPLKTIAAIKKSRSCQLLLADPAHSLVIAPSGSGKGVGYVIPTLLSYRGAVFVTDIKGENYRVTARARRLLGQKVVAFDPFSLTDAPKIALNPLALIDKDPNKLLDEVVALAQILSPTNRYGSENEQHFSEHSASLIQCLILYVLLADDFLEEEKHLGSVYDLLSLSDDCLKAQLQHLGERQDLAGGVMARLARGYAGTADREFSGITNTARKHMRFIDSPPVRQALSGTGFSSHGLSSQSFDTKEMISGKVDFFLCIPPETLDSQFRLIRLMVSLIFNDIQRARGKKTELPLLMVIDEMPALEYVPQFENMLVYGRGYGITLMGFSQSLELIQSLYPKTWRTFLSSNMTIFFDASELHTSEYVSKKLGHTTIQQSSTNKGKRKSLFSQKSQTQESTTTSSMARAFLTPDEVATLGSEVSVVFMKGARPILLKKPTYYENKRWAGLWDPNTFEGQ